MTPNRSLLAVVVCLSVTAAACSAGPSSRPDVAVEQNSPGLPADSEDPDGEELRELEVPSTDLAWNDCTQTTLDSFGLTSRTPGLILECTAFEAPVDASGEMFGSFTVGVMRAKLNTTPDDAAPLVFTSGADRASIEMLADITSGQSSTLLAAHPIVAIDRRGIGRSSAVNCVTSDSRIPLSDLGQFASSDGDAVDRAVDAGRTATIECTDLLQPQELAFGVSYAADDLEELRLNWGVETLGIIGSGNGASIALAYAARYPDRVARMILDSPTDVTADQLRKAEHRTQGREAAFAAFTQRCIALECSLGPDPRTAVTDLIEAADRGELAPVSTHELLDGIAYALASSATDPSRRALDLSDTLSAARDGDFSELAGLITRAAAAYGTDGQFVARCTDGRQWPTPQAVRDVQPAWSEQYPVFGTDAALAAVACSSWPTAPAPPLPSDLTVPVLSFSGGADPVVGNGGFAAMTGLIAATGTRSAAMTWQGSGHPVLGGSQCAQAAAAAYWETASLPPDGSVCPA